MLNYHCHSQTKAVEGGHCLVRTASVSDAPAVAAVLKSVSAVWSVAQLEASIYAHEPWQLLRPSAQFCLIILMSCQSLLPAGLGTMQASMQQQHTLVLLATAGEVHVGCVIAWLIEDELQILDIAVQPTHRRQGHGKALMEAVMFAALGQGCILATLEVSRDNAAAVQLYVQLGFQTVHVRKSYYGDGSDALLMNKCMQS